MHTIQTLYKSLFLSASFFITFISIVPHTHAAPMTFGQLCSQPGVVYCQGFDSSAAVSANYFPPSTGEIRGTFDTTQAADGAGSLRFTYPGNSGANASGDWRIIIPNLPGGKIGQGQDLYWQMRYRLSPEMIGLLPLLPGSGYKAFILWQGGNPSCSAVQLVQENQNMTDRPTLYTDCGAWGIQTLNPTPPNATDRWNQQGEDDGVTGKWCHYRTASNNPDGSSCYTYQANKWMTLYYHLRVGTFGQPNSVVESWVSFGDGPLQKWANRKNFVFVYNSASTDGFNEIMLTPYTTRKDATVSHPTGYVWYDDLIFSTQPLPDPYTGVVPPNISGTPPSAPATPTASSITNTSVTLAWPWVPGSAFYVLNRNGSYVGSQSGWTATPFTDATVAAGTTYTYTVTAHSATGMRSAPSAPVTVTTSGTATTSTTPTTTTTTSTTSTTPTTTTTSIGTSSLAAPTSFFPQGISSTGVTLSWGPVVGARSYNLYRNGALIKNITGASSFQNTGLQPATTYIYTVTAVDASGRESAQSLPVSVTTFSTLTLTLTSALTGTSAKLTWNATNATSCTASGGWSGTKALSGSLTVSPTVTTTYLLTCTSATGNLTRSVTVPVPATGDSLLKTYAAALQPGSFMHFSDNASLTGMTIPYSALYWNNSAVWNPIRKQFQWIGAGGTCCTLGQYYLVTYSEATNTWTSVQTPFPNGVGHGFDGNALDPKTGIHYFGRQGDTKVYTWDGTSWGSLPTLPFGAGTTPSLSWFPDINGGKGGLVYIGSDGNWAWYDGSAWHVLPSLGIKSYNQFSEYNPVHHVLWIGGGNGTERVSYKVGPNLIATRLQDGPASLSLGLSYSLESVDPVSGLYIVMNSQTGEWWSYNIVSDSWTKFAPFSPTIDWFNTRAQVAIPEYGVIMFLKQYSGLRDVYLYRYAPMPAPASPPVVAPPIVTVPSTQTTTPPATQTTTTQTTTNSPVVTPPATTQTQSTTPAPTQTTQTTSGGGSGFGVPGTPPAPTRLAIPITTTQKTILSWSPVSNIVGVSGYSVERCVGVACYTFVPVATPTNTTYTDENLAASTTYRYRVQAIDTLGRRSPYSAELQVTTERNSAAVASSSSVPGTTPAVVPAAAPAVVAAPGSGSSVTVSGPLYIGQKSSKVCTLQTFLSNYPQFYPDKLVTCFYGPLTTKAVAAFQKYYGIVSTGDAASTGLGIAGPRTRAKMNALLAQ